MSRLCDGTLSRPSAGVCLTEANHRGGVEAKLGQAALAWIWDQRGDLTYPDDNDLVYAIVDLLVREGQEDVWRWMQCESPRSKELPEFVRYEWRDTALQGLLMSKARLATNRSLDHVLETFLCSERLFKNLRGAASWLHIQLRTPKCLQANEVSPSVNGGRIWHHRWPATSVDLWDRAIQEVSLIDRSQLKRAEVAMYHVRARDPEPALAAFKSALVNPDHSLCQAKSGGTRSAFVQLAIHAAEELKLLGRHDDAAVLTAARREVFPPPQQYGDRADREGIFAPGNSVKRLPYPKFK